MSANIRPVEDLAKQHFLDGITTWSRESARSFYMGAVMEMPTISKRKQLAKVFVCSKT